MISRPDLTRGSQFFVYISYFMRQGGNVEMTQFSEPDLESAPHHLSAARYLGSL